MKVAVSIPDDVFIDAEALAKRLKLPRSKLYARAIRDFVGTQRDNEAITEAINAAIDAAGPEDLRFTRRASSNILRKVEW